MKDAIRNIYYRRTASGGALTPAHVEIWQINITSQDRVGLPCHRVLSSFYAKVIISTPNP